MIKRRSKHDEIWRALADGTRREILDFLAGGAKTTGELVDKFDDLCRTNVMKHIDVLVDTNLIIVRREGRVRWNHLNPAPIQSVCDRWVSRHVKKMASAMSRLKEHAEAKAKRTKSNQDTPKASSEMTSTIATSSCHKYELEIAIDASRESVWKAMFETQINGGCQTSMLPAQTQS